MKKYSYTGGGQYSAIKKNNCGKATTTVHQEREVTRSGQYSAVRKINCGKATTTVHQGREVTRSGQYSAVKKIAETIIATRLPPQCIRDERLQVQDSILLLKKKHCGKATRTVHQGREVTRSGQYSAIKKKHCRKATSTVHQAREVTG